MARVKMQEIVDELSSEMRKSLTVAVQEIIPDAVFDEYALFRAFRKAVGRKCNTWEKVSDHYVER